MQPLINDWEYDIIVAVRRNMARFAQRIELKLPPHYANSANN
jgi:hypothetical protein